MAEKRVQDKRSSLFQRCISHCQKYTGLFVPGKFNFLKKKKKKNQGACPVHSLTQKDHTKPKTLARDKHSSLFRRVVSDEEKKLTASAADEGRLSGPEASHGRHERRGEQGPPALRLLHRPHHLAGPEKGETCVCRAICYSRCKEHDYREIGYLPSM